MTKQTRHPYSIRFAWEYVPLYVAGILLVFGWSLFAYFTQNWFWSNVPSAGIWAILGVVGATVAFLPIFVKAVFSDSTKRLYTGNHIFRAARMDRSDFLKVTVDHFGIHPSLVASGGGAQIETPELAAALEVPAGTDGYGNRVEVMIAGPGGYDAFFYRSPWPGGQGFIVLHGKHQIIPMQGGYFCPYNLELRDPTHVEIEVIRALNHWGNPNWVQGRSPVYSVGDLEPAIVDWLKEDPMVHGIVLTQIGFDGLADRFLQRFDQLFAAGKLPNLKTTGSVLPSPAATKEIRAVLTNWLSLQRPLALAVGGGDANASYWRSKYYETLSKYNYAVSMGIETDDALALSRKALTGSVARVAKTVGKVARNPVDDVADRTSGMPGLE